MLDEKVVGNRFRFTHVIDVTDGHTHIFSPISNVTNVGMIITNNYFLPVSVRDCAIKLHFEGVIRGFEKL